MSLVSSGFRQGLHCLTETRDLESRPGKSNGTSKKSILSGRGRSSGVFAADVGPTARTSKGPFQFRECFVLRTVASVPFLRPWRMVEAEL